MMQGFGKFDQAKHDVLGMHNNVEAQLHRLRRAVPEIGFQIDAIQSVRGQQV